MSIQVIRVASTTEPLVARKADGIPNLKSNVYEICAEARARIYHAQLNTKPCQWSYSRLKGTIMFGRDSAAGTAEPYSFWLSDEESGRTVWMFQLPVVFHYETALPFFHVFQGRTRTYGLLFDDDKEAIVFAKTIVDKTHPAPTVKRMLSIRRNNSMKVGITPAPIPTTTAARPLISAPAPNSFVHVEHGGINDAEVLRLSNPSGKENIPPHEIKRGDTVEHHVPAGMQNDTYVSEHPNNKGLMKWGFGKSVRDFREYLSSSL